MTRIIAAAVAVAAVLAGAAVAAASAAPAAPAASPVVVTTPGIQVGPPITTTQPTTTTGGTVSGGGSHGPAWWEFWDVTGQIGNAIDSWFSGLVTDALDPTLSLVGDTVLSTPEIAGQQEVGQIWLVSLGIADSADRLAKTLSGGQRRKLELARALVTDPRILFLDEATLGLDVDARRTFWGQIRGLADEGRTVFFTTHYMEEAEVADRIALIDSGRIVALGTPSELKARVGGGVVTLRTDDDERAREWLRGRGFAPEAGGQGITIVHADPAAIIPDLLRNLPVRVDRAEVHAPSLEDVFLKLTGRGLEGGGGKP